MYKNTKNNFKNMKKILIAVAIGLVAIFAGCISTSIGGGPSETPRSAPSVGVAFTNFYPVAPQVQAGGSATLYLSVQNNGYYKASDVKVILFNCGSINTGTLSDESSYTCNNEIEIGDLDPPDRDLGVPGEVAEEQITFDVPDNFPEGRSPSTFSARVSYDYSTTASRDVVITSFENWKEKGGNLEVGQLTFLSNPAPLSLNIIAPSEPIIVTDPSDPTEDFTVSVDIKNLGGGFVKNKKLYEIKLCYDSQYVVPIDKNGNSIESTESPSEDFYYGGDSCLIIDENNNPEKLELVGLTNQWRTVDARFKVMGNANLIQEVASFSATITYNYQSDATTQITVLKT